MIYGVLSCKVKYLILFIIILVAYSEHSECKELTSLLIYCVFVNLLLLRIDSTVNYYVSENMNSN